MKDCTPLDLWLDIAQSLTIIQAAQVLAQLRQGYSQHYVYVRLGYLHLEGSFAFLAAYKLGQYRNWYNVRCKFMGGPEGRTEVIGNLGMFVADCFMREVVEGREHRVWDVYRKIHAEDSEA